MNFTNKENPVLEKKTHYATISFVIGIPVRLKHTEVECHRALGRNEHSKFETFLFCFSIKVKITKNGPAVPIYYQGGHSLNLNLLKLNTGRISG